MARNSSAPALGVIENQDFTDMRALFVQGIVINGLNQTEAARQAGYASPCIAATRLMRIPAILEAIRTARMALVESESAGIAISTLNEVMKDKNAPASARVSAAKAVLKIGGYEESGKLKGRNPHAKKDLSDMTPAELREALDDMKKQLDDAGDVVDDIAAAQAQPVQTIDLQGFSK